MVKNLRGGGLNFSKQNGTPPLHPQNFSAAALSALDSTFFHYIPVCEWRSKAAAEL